MRNVKENGRLRQIVASIFDKIADCSLFDYIYFIALLVLLYIIIVFNSAIY